MNGIYSFFIQSGCFKLEEIILESVFSLPFTKASVFPLDLLAHCSSLATWSALSLTLHLAPAIHNLLFPLFYIALTCPQCTPAPASCICKRRFLDFLAPCGTLLLARTLGYICTCLGSDSGASCPSCSCRHKFRPCTPLLLPCCSLPCNSLATPHAGTCTHLR